MSASNPIRQKITPHLWYDREAIEAAEFYVSVFSDAAIENITTLRGTPGGDSDIVTMQILGQQFTLISAGPLFKFNPSVSLMVVCQTKEEVDSLWEKLAAEGTALMELDAYPFSERYGWIMDKYGLSWQLMYMGGGEVGQRITPTLMFVGDVYGRAEEAINFYTSVFRDTQVGDIARYGAGMEHDREGTVMYANFQLEGQQFAAMDSGYPHKFAFDEAISLMVHCADQAEIDYYWDRLSAVPEAEQCGWLKDKFGLSWQVVPDDMDRMMREGSEEQIARVTAAFLKMKKFDIAVLEEAYRGAE